MLWHSVAEPPSHGFAASGASVAPSFEKKKKKKERLSACSTSAYRAPCVENIVGLERVSLILGSVCISFLQRESEPAVGRVTAPVYGRLELNL